MSEFGDDIEFDFFDEPETREDTPPRQRTVRRPGGGPPRRPVGPAGFTPLLRLAGLIAFAILIVVLLVVSAVIWQDLFKAPATVELKKQGIGGVVVPASNFLTNADLASARSMVPVWQRVHGATTGGTPGGLHGTGLVSVKALPKGQTLSTSTENTVTASTNLAFA